ncbi:MAG: type I methionyl aminopeptidase [Polyangiaceae bacterium]|nr:type I methionyl aminopeptidase [Polyangiaceae bacterium]
MQNRYWTRPLCSGQTQRVSIYIHSGLERQALRRAGRVAAATLAAIGERIAPGITTAQIDEWVRQHTEDQGARPSQLGYHGFPAATCTSRNQVVCHGIPKAHEVLCEGDIINVDITSNIGGFHGDTSATFFVGQPSAGARKLVHATRRSLEAGIEQVSPRARLGDIGAAIEEVAKAAGFSVVTSFGGHGIGKQMHMPPHVNHVGKRGRGLRLVVGMAFTIEPMLNEGSPEVEVLEDGWTVVTKDGGLSAQFEHTVLVTEAGCEVLTATSCGTPTPG